MKPLVLVTAPVGTRSGYGSHSIDICRSLINMDKFDIKIWPVRWGMTPQDALSEENPSEVPIIVVKAKPFNKPAPANNKGSIATIVVMYAAMIIKKALFIFVFQS